MRQDKFEHLGVSRETLERFGELEALIRKWNPAINLISKSTIEDIWERHIWDSAQIYPLASTCGRWLDIGSGGGFPSLVVAIMQKQIPKADRLMMIESDARKSTFLKTVIRELGLTAEVIVDRIELVPPAGADVLTARALAPLTDLLKFSERHSAAGGVCIFPKGAGWRKEVEEAQKLWSFSLVDHQSLTNEDARILEIRDIRNVE